MDKGFKNDISVIKKAIENDRLVVFAGAGVSKDSGIPLWGELIEEVKGYLDKKTSEKDPLKIAQILYNEKGEKEYNDILEKLIFRNSYSYNPIHEVLFELNPHHIITTNYDCYFEDIIRHNGLPFSVVSKDIDLPYAKHKNLIIKYHGDFQNKNIVFKEDDYLYFSKNHTLKEIYVKSLFSNKVILFVGYSASDQNLKYLIQEIQFILKKHQQKAYLITHRSDHSEAQKNYFKNLGINIVRIPSKSTDEEVNKLSSTGNKLYQALKFIQNFDLFKYEREQNHKSNRSNFIEDLYTSYNRFYYFPVLPKNIIGSLYPLKKDEKGRSNIEVNTLVDFDENFHSFLKKYDSEKDSTLTDEEKYKLNYVIARLLQSNIHKIGIKVGKKGFNRNQITGDIIDLIDKLKPNETETSLLKKINSFEYSEVVKTIEKYIISESSNLGEDLIYAHCLYLIGENYKSYNAYKKIRVKANKLNRMEVSFVCTYNMKRIGISIQGRNIYDFRYSFEDLKSIVIEAEKIDLDKELFRVKNFLDKDVYIFIREIRDGRYIQRLCNTIENLYIKVQSDVQNIESGGSSINSHYLNLYNATKELKDFLSYSFIIGNGFSMIDDAFQKSIKTFIRGFYIGTIKLNSDQKNFGISKLEEFNSYIFNLIVKESKPKEVSGFLRQINIHNYKFDNRSQDDVTKIILNYFNSFSKKNRFSNQYDENRIFTRYLNYNSNFKNIVLKQFKNICLVLSYFEFSENQLKEIYSRLNLLIQYEVFSPRQYSSFVGRLIKNKYKEIGYDLLIDTLNILNNKNLQYEPFYADLLKKMKILNPDFLNSHFIINEMSASEYGLVRCNLLTYYNTLPKAKKESFLNEFERKLKKHFECYPVYLLLSNNIIISDDVRNQYKEHIHKLLKRFESKDLESKRLMNIVLQYFKLIYSRHIIDEELSSLNLNLNFLDFLINPKNHNINSLKLDWLKLIDYDPIIQGISEIIPIKDWLKENLTKEFDSDLSRIYFRLMNEQCESTLDL